MFGLVHNLYMGISLFITIILLVVFAKFIKDNNYKNTILKAIAIIVVAIHFSPLWINYLKYGYAEVASPMLFPIYPCNVIMWLLLIVASFNFNKNKDKVWYKILSEFVAIAGVICGCIGIILNENFISNPTLTDYEILSGMLSHSFMVLGCLYLFVSGFVKIRVFNVVSCFCGLILFLIDGGIINLIYYLAKLDPCNSMYMLEVPFDNFPWLTPYLMGIFGLAIIFIVAVIVEQLVYKKEDRWYNKLKVRVKGENK